MKQRVRAKGMDFLFREVKSGITEGYYNIRDHFKERKTGLVFVRHDAHYPYAKGWGTHNVCWCCPGLVKKWGTLKEVIADSRNPEKTTP